MVIYADSSFLVSLYVHDALTERAKACLQRNPAPITLTPFSISETQHALRMLAFRGDVSESEMTQYLLLFGQDEEEGLYEMIPIEGEALFHKASHLSHRYALTHAFATWTCFMSPSRSF